MKPQKLIICGWGPYKDRVEIDFGKFQNKGLFLITGATGAGKTTLFDAISYALYGALSGKIRDKERSSVRSDFASPDTPTFVELEMIHAGKAYRIVRNPEYMRPKKNASKGNPYTKEKENAILYLPEEKVVEGVKEVNAYMQELMSLDYSQFKQLSMIAQGEFAKLLTATPKEKTKIFREIFGTGVYERFTGNLATRAKKHYVLLSEQKNKLDEDLRLLAGSVQGMDIPVETKEVFWALINAEYPNYEQIRLKMEELEQVAGNGREEFQKAYRRAERQIEKKSTILVQRKEENKRIMELQNAFVREQELAELREVYALKEERYKKAVNAGWVEPAEVHRRQVTKRLQEAEAEQAKLKETLEKDRVTIAQLAVFWEHQEECRLVIQKMMEYERTLSNICSLEKVWKERELALAQGRSRYLQKEACSLEAKQVYEEALRVQKYAAIGMAAALLEVGKPCPVCGSLEHPNPAREREGMLSEEELEALKKAYEAKENATRACHSEVVMLQTQAQESGIRLEEEKKRGAVMKSALDEVTEPVFTEFMHMSAEAAEKLWQTKYDTMQKLLSVVEERESRAHKLQELQKDLQEEVCMAQENFTAVMKQYGFAGEEEYSQAYLSKTERDVLSEDLLKYQNSVNANRELINHLKQMVKSEEPFDIPELEAELSAEKCCKEEALKKLKVWEQFLNELKKTRRLFLEKQEKIEQQSAEYGRIKELENIAAGYNSKKLVFEQYVLAGYFEQILKAANVRFGKMTLGRYEMHRSKEVSDGRIKDNLEIEVMDFYTGKLRSVRTLSGGESFKASLSLALGLSDVIQAMNGGIRVDTLFIDEGFGALDSESLDQACATLMNLVETERLIGIISHVPELRERIHKQIVIDKTGSGSSLKVVIN